MNKEVMFSSTTPEWETPQDFFDALDAEFHFTLDPCSTDENAKCTKHYTQKDDGLSKDWTGETVYCNPPYGREMPKWIAKCAEHAMRGGLLSCLFLRVLIQKHSINTYTEKQRFAL